MNWLLIWWQGSFTTEGPHPAEQQIKRMDYAAWEKEVKWDRGS